MNPAGAQVRVAAARAVLQVLQGRSLKAAMAQERSAFADARDRALLEAVCHGAIRHRRALEFALGRFLAQPLERRDPLAHALLLIGLTQLHVLALPAHAAVSATIEAARLLDRGARAGLINAVLRRSQREGLPESDDPGVRGNHPDWLLRQLQQDWPQDWSAIMDANNAQAPLWLRVNGRRTTRAAVAAMLQDAGVAHHLPEFPPQAIRIDDAIAPTRLPGWDEGLITVQDVSAQLAAEALAPAAGAQVLDLCAAPGGKAAQLAERDPALLVLVDIDAERLQRVQDLFGRLQLASETVRFAAADAALPLPDSLPAAYDAILVDAPCSATGIIRRQPDVKWHRQPKDIAALNTLQWRLLKNAWRHLRPGGRLLYSTCSVLKAENETLAAQFLAQNPDARALPLDARFGRVSGVGRQRLPGFEGGDGFFYVLFERI